MSLVGRVGSLITRKHPWWMSLVVAVFCAAMGAVIRLTALHGLGMKAPFLTFYPALVIAALAGRLAGGLLATVLGGLLAEYFWMEPAGRLAIRDAGDWLALSVYLLSGCMISLLSEGMIRSQIKVRLLVLAAAETKKVQALEQSVRESEEQFRTLANSIPQLCWMAHADGWIFWYNERWYQYTGTTPEDMQGWGLAVRARPGGAARRNGALEAIDRCRHPIRHGVPAARRRWRIPALSHSHHAGEGSRRCCHGVVWHQH